MQRVYLPEDSRLSPFSEVYLFYIYIEINKKRKWKLLNLQTKVTWVETDGKQIMFFSNPCYLARCDLITERVGYTVDSHYLDLAYLE